MNQSRRNLLFSSLFGAGYVGLRALATGIPASILLNPRLAHAGGPCATKNPQFVIMSTSGLGDPLNANAPGTYADTNIVHCPSLPSTQIKLGSQMYTAAQPWAMTNLDPTRTSAWHLMTNTPVHPKEADVLKLMSAIAPADMFPSFLSANLASCLGTIQTQPITVGATTPSEALTYQGAALPILPPLALQATLAAAASPLTNLTKIRTDTLNKLQSIYATGASTAQQKFVSSFINSQSEAHGISQSLLSMLGSITPQTDSNTAQITAALTLILMKVSPVIVIHTPFGGDNHHDADLAVAEGPQTTSGFAAIDSLLGQLKSLGLQDKVSFISLNVFGRTLGQSNVVGGTIIGRGHNPNHQVSLAIGAPFKGGVYGGVAPVGNDYGATTMSSTTGAGGSGGDIQPIDTLASFGMTVATAVGVDPAVVAKTITAANDPMGSKTAKIVQVALA